MNIDISIMNVGWYKGDSLSERPKHESTASQLLCQKFYRIFRNLQIKIASRIWLRKWKTV